MNMVIALTAGRTICPSCFEHYDQSEELTSGLCWLCHLGYTGQKRKPPAEITTEIPDENATEAVIYDEKLINEQGHTCGSWPNQTWLMADYHKKAKRQRDCAICLNYKIGDDGSSDVKL